jgi:hypothetical protein
MTLSHGNKFNRLGMVMTQANLSSPYAILRSLDTVIFTP